MKNVWGWESSNTALVLSFVKNVQILTVLFCEWNIEEKWSLF